MFIVHGIKSQKYIFSLFSSFLLGWEYLQTDLFIYRLPLAKGRTIESRTLSSGISSYCYNYYSSRLVCQDTLKNEVFLPGITFVILST